MNSILNKNTLGVKNTRNIDDVAATLAKLEANQDYIAMMADIELDEDEAEESEVE